MTCNYKSPDGVFPLYALRELENKDEPWIKDAIEKLDALAKEFNDQLCWHTISCEPGFYDGLQLYVKCNWEKHEVFEDVWGCFLAGLSSVPEKCGYAPYPFSFDSPNFNNAQMVLGSDSSFASQEQLDEASDSIRRDVFERYQREIDLILGWLEETAITFGLAEIIANGKTPIWA